MLSKLIFVDLNTIKLYEIKTNTLNYTIKRQLKQRDEEKRLHLITFFSEKLNGVQLNYNIPNKELMFIIRAFEE